MGNGCTRVIKIAPKPKETSYNLSRNKSESAIRRRGDLPDASDCLDSSMPSTYQQVEGNRAYGNLNKSTEVLYQQSDLGYASDVCDYNIAKSREDRLRSAESKSESRSLKTRSLQQDDSYVHQVRPSSMVSPQLKPYSPSLEVSLHDRRQKLIQERAKIFRVTNGDNEPAEDNSPNFITMTASLTNLPINEDDDAEPMAKLDNSFDSLAINNPAYIAPITSTPMHSLGKIKLDLTFQSGSSSLQSERRNETEDEKTTIVKKASDDLIVTNVQTPHAITQTDTLTPQHLSVHFSENNPTVGTSGSDTVIGRGMLEQQSSTEDDRLSSGSRSPRKNSKSSSGVRAKIARRKLMKQVNNNTLDVPHGSLSDQENLSEQNEDSVEEKHDSEPIDDITSKKSKGASRSSDDVSLENKIGSQLTPEMARKDWNSRFSNLKSSFDAASEEELSGKSRSPSMNRTEPIFSSATTESRGRSRFKEKLGTNQRSRSAHNINSGDASTSERFAPRRISSEMERKSPVERAPSKEDKNKINAITARSSSNSGDNRDDEYAQYLETVNKMRANNQRIMAQAWVNRQQLQKENTNLDPFQRRSYQGPLIPTQLKPTQPVVPMSRNSSTSQVTAKTARSSEQNPPNALPNPPRPVIENKEHDQRPTENQVNSVPENITPEDTNPITKRISKSLPKENVSHEFDEESQAEILGFVKAQDNEPIAKSNDMDYQEYMNIINRVRKTKEFTRIRTEQYRLASMYAQEKKRQEELRQEEERLRKEREQYEREKSEVPIITTVASLQSVSTQPSSNSTRSSESNSSLQGLEKGQLDNKESEQKKISPSPVRVLDNKEADSTPKLSPQGSFEVDNVENPPPQIQEQSQSQPVDSENQKKLEQIRQEHIRQQQIREEQVRSEQEKLAKLREEQLKQEKEREEILRLEYERLQQIREEHRHLEEERRRQEEQYMTEQMRLEEERRKQEKLQAEKNAEYNRQRLDMEARHFAKANRERERNVSLEENLSQEDLFYNERMFQQDKLREAHRKEETQIRQEKLNLIKQEEMLIQRQEDMLKQIEAERENLTKQEDLIRSRQQERLQQVRREKMLLEKQEEMLQMREQQLMQERLRYEQLRTEQRKLREQEESIRKRQEEISKELLTDFSLSQPSPEIMVCQAREGQVFQGPHAEMAVVIPALTDPGLLDSDGDISRTTNTSTNSMSFKQPNLEPVNASTISSKTSPYSSSSGIGTLSNIPQIEPEEILSEGSSDEDTLDEEDGYYESKVEVQQNQTSIPTSVRTIETKLDNAPWAQITPYLTYSEEQKRQFQQDEINAIFSEAKNFVQPGVITSPESTRTSTNLITTPDGSWSLQSQASQNDAASLSSSCPGSPPPIPPLPLTDSDEGSFYPVQPEVPQRTDSFAITAAAAISTSVSSSTISELSNRRSLIEMPQSSQSYGPLLSPRLGGPGSAFKPYSSNENLHDPSICSAKSSDTSGSELPPPTTNYALMRNGDVGGIHSKFKQPVYGKVKELRRPLVAAFSTTDTEPEMRECNLPPHDAKGKRRSKMIPSYSTSETEEEYLAYMRARPKWHGKGGHKDSWDPLLMQSPPQITQKPVGVIQKPKPHVPSSIEDTSFVSSEVPPKMQPEPVPVFHQPVVQKQNFPPLAPHVEPVKPIVPQPGLLSERREGGNNQLLQPNMERIQKSDSIIELREKPTVSKSAAGDVPLKVQSTKHQLDQDAVPVPITVTEINKRSSLPILKQQAREAPVEKEEVFIDPLERKKKELHQKLMNETLMKVEQKKDHGPVRKFNNSGIQRTNPTIAAMEIMTRKELKMSEMEERLARGEAPAPLMNIPKRNQVVEHHMTEKPKPLTEKPSDIMVKRPVQSPSSDVLMKAEISAKTVAEASTGTTKTVKHSPIVQKKEAHAQNIKTENIKMDKADNQPSPRILHQPTASEKSPFLSKQRSLEIQDETRSLVKPHPMMAAAVKKFESEQSVKSSKPDTAPKPGQRSVSREPEEKGGPPVIILKKQPKRLDPEEIRARKNSAEKKTDTKEPEKKLSKEENQQKIKFAAKDQTRSLSEASAKRKSLEARKSDSEISRKPIKKQEASPKPKQISQDLVLKEDEESEDESSQIERIRHETVRKAAERFEREAQLSSSGPNPSGFIGYRERSKSIGNNLGQVIDEDHQVNIPKAFLPWASTDGKVDKPMSAVKRRDLKNRGYALRMSKSSDSITAAKLLAQQRQEDNERGLRINQNMSKSIERQIDVYSKTRDDIRRILSMAKTCSVSERVNLFNQDLVKPPVEDNREEKAEAIRREIQEAKAKSMSEASGDDIEFQSPVESKVKPLKIPMKPKFVDPEKSVSKKPTLRINQSASGKDSEPKKSSLRINKTANTSQVQEETVREQRRASIENIGSVKSKIESYLQAAEETTEVAKEPPPPIEIKPKSILVNKKKTPKLLHSNKVAEGQMLQIYAQSATDYSAEEDEEFERFEKILSDLEGRGARRGERFPKQLSTTDPGPDYLQVPKASQANKVNSFGLAKSKSFGSPGQFECGFEADDLAKKTETMMAFFGTTKPRPKHPSDQRGVQRRSSITSISDEILGDEDLQDVDEVFESLLHNTFSSGHSTIPPGQRRVGGNNSVGRGSSSRASFGKVSGTAAAAKLSQNRNTVVSHRQTGADAVQQKRSGGNMMVQNQQQNLERSRSFGNKSAIASAVDNRRAAEDAVFNTRPAAQSPPMASALKQKNFDPVAALPTSHTKKYLPRQQTWSAGMVSPPPFNSPSPTQRVVIGRTQSSFRKFVKVPRPTRNLLRKSWSSNLSSASESNGTFETTFEITFGNGNDV